MAAQKVNSKIWDVLSSDKPKNAEEVVDVLLKNRGLSKVDEKREFFKPINPEKLTPKQLGISKTSLNKAILRIKKAIKKNEGIIVYGDYDADGICATAILWETLYYLNRDTLPYIPDRISEGYGINGNSVKKLKREYPNLGLIITVDNGIVANEEIKKINKLGIDVIITDHHQLGKVLPKATSIVHTDKICGAAISWFFAKEIRKMLRVSKTALSMGDGLELAAIGTIADQLPLIGVNRSIAKYGLSKLQKAKRLGLLQLFEEAAIDPNSITSYTVGFMIAPRINAMGRMKQGIESLRLLCTNDESRAKKLALELGKTNSERQKVVDEVLLHARKQAELKSFSGAIVISHESYHEGVIGLAAAKLVEEFWRPAIVLSKGEQISKASARSIPGFNIIEAIRSLDDLLDGGGGHAMAAGFSIKNDNLDTFTKRFEEESAKLLNEDILTPKKKIDLEMKFDLISWKLVRFLENFEPTGYGNPTPTFVTYDVDVVNAKSIGNDGRHLKLKLTKNKNFFDAIGFGMGDFLKKAGKVKVDIVYSIEENVWNGNRSLQLKLKDIRRSDNAMR